MNLLTVILNVLIFSSTCVFSSTPGDEGKSPVFDVVDKIDKLVINNKNSLLVKFLKDKERFDNFMINMDVPDRPDVPIVVNSFRAIICTNGLNCMVNFGKGNKGLLSLPVLSNFLASHRELLEPLIGATSEEAMIHVLTKTGEILVNYAKLLNAAKSNVDLNKFLVNPKQIDDLAKSLAGTLINFDKNSWVGEENYYDELMMAVKGKGDGKGNYNGKGGNTTSGPLSLGMKIILFGALPLIAIAVVGTIIYFVLNRKR